MNKTLLASTIVMTIGATSAQAISYSSTGNNFTMLIGDGSSIVGGTNDVTMTWDGTLNSLISDTNINMTLSSTSNFFGHQWTAHDARVFGPGTYTFDTCAGNIPGSDNPPDAGCGPLSLTVGANQIGAHMLFDWSVVSMIDLVNVWDANGIFGDGTDMQVCNDGQISRNACAVSADPWSNDPLNIWNLSSADGSGNGVPGIPFVDGPFPGFNGNFNLMLIPVPIPAAAWLFGTGFLGLIGLARRRKA